MQMLDALEMNMQILENDGNQYHYNLLHEQLSKNWNNKISGDFD